MDEVNDAVAPAEEAAPAIAEEVATPVGGEEVPAAE